MKEKKDEGLPCYCDAFQIKDGSYTYLLTCEVQIYLFHQLHHPPLPPFLLSVFPLPSLHKLL